MSNPTTDPALGLSIEDMLARMRVEFDSAWMGFYLRLAVPEARLVPVDTGAGIPLIVAQVSYGRNADVEAVIAGKAIPEQVIATADGRHAVLAAHDPQVDGPFGESVYVERWTGPSCRPFHGWIDATSRKIVQWG